MEPDRWTATPAHVDRAMGLELEAVDLGVQLDWAEAQGRTADASTLRARLADVLDELGQDAEPPSPSGPALHIHARRAGEAA